MPIPDTDMIKILNKLELAISRARSKFTEKMTAQVFAESLVLELRKMAKELGDT